MQIFPPKIKAGKRQVRIFLYVILLIPSRETAEALAKRRRRLEAEVALERCGVGIGHRHVARLHGHEFAVGVEVIVCGQHPCGDQFLLKYTHEVEQVLGMVVADVVDLVRRHGQPVLPRRPLGSMLHYPHHALDYVVDVGKVAPAVAVVEYPYRLPCTQLVAMSSLLFFVAAYRLTGLSTLSSVL